MKTLYERTQATAVLGWLRLGKPLTRYEGFMSLRIADLPKVIAKIRKSGAIIETEMITHNGKYGLTKYAKYHLIQDVPQIGDLEVMIKSVKHQLDTVNRRSIIQESDMDIREADLDAIERQLHVMERLIDAREADLDAIDRQFGVMERLMKDNPVIEITE
jgi:hypothetical protein